MTYKIANPIRKFFAVFKNVKIRTKIFWAIFLTVTIAMATFIYQIHFHSEKQIINEYEQIAIQDGQGKARALSNTFSNFENMANQIARSIPKMNNWQEYLSNKKDIFPEIKSVFIFNKKGEILFQSAVRGSTTQFPKDIFQLLFTKVKSNGAGLVSLTNQGKFLKHMFILSGITRLKNNRESVAALLELDIPYIFNAVLNYPDEKGFIHYYFVNRNGLILFTADSSEIGRRISDIPVFRRINQGGSANLESPNGIHSFEMLDRKHKVFIFQEPLESNHFGIVERENLSPILKAFQPKTQFMGIVIAFNLLIIFLISELLALYFSRPLRFLVNALGSYQTKGVIPPMLGVKNRSDEFGILARRALGHIEEIEKKNQQVQTVLEELKISEERYFQFLNNSPNMILVRQSGRVIFTNRNAEKILGIKKEEIDSSDIVLFKNLQGKVYPLLTINETYRSFPIEGTLILAGNELPVLVYYARFEHQRTKNELFILVDVRRVKQLEIKEKQMEWELIESNRLASLGILMAGIARHLQDPLNAIIGYAEILKMKYPDETEVNTILSAANQIEKTILLATEHSKKEIENQEIKIQLNDLLMDLLNLLRMNYRSKEPFQDIVHLDPNLPAILGRYEDFSISLEAFLYNAVEAMEKSKKKILTVTTQSNDNRIEIRIDDTGSGINRENLDKIFLPFFTTKKSDGASGKRQNHNMGLGLFMAHRLLQAYGAKIDVRSRVNNGSTFVITIPIQSRNS